MYLIFILNKLVYKYGLDLSKYLIYIYKVLSINFVNLRNVTVN